MTYRLSNSLVTFLFETDATTGLKLVSFQRLAGNQSWANAETNLWKATVFDTTSAAPFSTTNLTPTAATFSALQVGNVLTATWTAEPVGADALTVVVTFSLGTDWLETTISASWVGTPTDYALDSIGALPLKIDPLNRTNDFACMSNVFGVLSKDPIKYLRYDPTLNGIGTLFGNGETTNTWNYPTGRGASMAVWGYYENTTHEGWMVWAEDWSLALFSARFESDATRLVFEVFEPQEDHVLVGNNGRTLGSQYTFCLRPLRTTQDHGWVDIAKHYRTRLEASSPSWLPAKRRDRSDLSDAEKGFLLPVDLSLDDNNHTLGDGKPGDLATILESLRTNSGAPASTPIFGTVEAPGYLLHRIAEDPTGDLRAKLLDLYENHNCFLQPWFPQIFGPGAGNFLASRQGSWPIERWDQTLGDSAELRYWTSNDGVGALRMSRKGYLEGGGVDRLMEGSGGYYRERNFPIVSYVPFVVTVTGNPSTSGFVDNMVAIYIPASGSARLAQATVTALGVNSVTVASPGFVDSLGNSVTPLNTGTLEVYEYNTFSTGARCEHAQVNAAAYFDRLKVNTTVGGLDDHGSCGMYVDVYSEPSMASPTPGYEQWCYHDDHGSWSKIDPGYVNHPLGGGPWHRESKITYINSLKQAARDLQVARGETPFFHMSCEDIDETQMFGFDFCWHGVSSGLLFRNTTGILPTVHQYKTVPMWAVVHAGRTVGRNLSQEVSSAALIGSAPFNRADLHATMGYWLSEWPYGLTLPMLSIFETNTQGLKDFWDNTQYADVTPGGISLTVKALRDLVVQLWTAHASWLPDYMPYGEFLAPATIDYALTEVTSGLSQTTFTSQYWTYDTIYERSAFPRVTHGIWKAANGSVCVLMLNWTGSIASLGGTIDTETAGLGAPASIDLKQVTLDTSKASGCSVTFDRNTAKLYVRDIAAFSMKAVIFTPASGAAAAEAPPITNRTAKAHMIRIRPRIYGRGTLRGRE